MQPAQEPFSLQATPSSCLSSPGPSCAGIGHLLSLAVGRRSQFSMASELSLPITSGLLSALHPCGRCLTLAMSWRAMTGDTDKSEFSAIYKGIAITVAVLNISPTLTPLSALPNYLQKCLQMSLKPPGNALLTLFLTH